MKHIKSINEYLNPVLPISKDELGMGIRINDKLTIDHQEYYFQSFDKDTNEIRVTDENGTEEFFDLDEINDTWELSSINDHDVVVESNSFEEFEEVSIIDHIIAGLESGELIIEPTDAGLFITDKHGEDIEAYTIPYGEGGDDYITGHTEEDEIEEYISEEDLKRITSHIHSRWSW
jgi:hypothetical protein